MNAYVANEGDGEIDLRAVILDLWRHRWWIVSSVVLFTGAFAALAYLMTPVYRSSAVVVAVRTDGSGIGSVGSALGQFGGLASLAGINIGDANSDTEETLAVLRSREFTERFIRDNNLMPVLFEKSWDPQLKKWRGDPKDWPTPAMAYRYFDTQVRHVSRDRKTNLIAVEIEWRDRNQAAQWANGLIERLNEEMRGRAIARTNASVEYLEKELAATSTVDTRQAINRLMEAQINQRMLANVTRDYVLRTVDRALPADPKDVAKPRKVLLLALGLAIGTVFGIGAVILMRIIRLLRESTAS